MEDPDNRPGHAARRWQAAFLACAAACLCASALAQRAPAKADAPAHKAEPPVRAAAGVLVEYEEKRDTNILYLEEKGGMLTAPSAIVGEVPVPAVPAKAPPAAPAKRRAP